MPRSSRHKSHKQSKHSSKEHSDSEDGTKKTKERSSKDESSSKAHGDSLSGEKRKTSSQIREGKDRKESSVHVNGDAGEDYVSSKRRKGKGDAFGDGDRWSGGGDGKNSSDRAIEKEFDKGNSLKAEGKHKDKSTKGESLKLEHKSKSKHNEGEVPGDLMEDSPVQAVVERAEKSRSASKRKSEKDSSSYKDGKDSKDKDRRSEKERNGGHGSKSGDAEVKGVDWDSGKKQPSDSVEERLAKHPRDNAEDMPKSLLPDRDYDKRARRKREGSSEKEKHSDHYKEADERRGHTKGDHLKDEKYKDEKYRDKGVQDNHRSERRKDEIYIEESDKDYRYYDEKYREDSEKYAKRQDRYHEDGDRDTRRKDEKHRGDGDRETKKKDDKYREDFENRRDDNYHEEDERNSRRRDDRYHDEGDKGSRRGNDRYAEDGGRDDKHGIDGYKDGGEKEYRHQDDKYRDHAEKDYRHNANLGDEADREKRPRESKYDHDHRERSRDRSDIKRSGDDIYPADGHARKSNAYDDSPNNDYRGARYKDDQNRKRTSEKEDYSESRPRSTRDQRSDSSKRSKLEYVSDKMKTSQRDIDSGHTSHSKRRGSPPSGTNGHRDNHRSVKQEDSKYRDYSIEERPRDHNASLERPEKSASRSLDKLGPIDHGHSRELSAERHHKTDLHLSPSQRAGGSRDWKGGKGSKELGLDAAPIEERVQADDDTVSISSPSMKNSNLRSLPPPPQFRNVGSPLPMGSVEDDVRGKSQNYHRRNGDPNMGRIQGNHWRGVPTWPSPVPNGFLPFPHAPPPVGYHPAMQPFAAPPMFGIRPPMDLNLHASYPIPDPDRYFGLMRPMGWQNQTDDNCPPVQSWDGSGAVFVDDSRIYGRPDWDQARNMAGHAWESSDDAWKGMNKDKGLEGSSAGKENSSHGVDEASQSVQANRIDRTLVDQQADSSEIHLSAKSTEKNNAVDPVNSVVDNDDFTEKEISEPVCLSIAYLHRLDVSADLTEPDLFSKFADLISVDKFSFSDADDSKILYAEDLVAVSTPSTAILPEIDDSVFQKSIFLYKKQKQALLPKDAAPAQLELIQSVPKPELCDTDFKPENLHLSSNTDVVSNIHMELNLQCSSPEDAVVPTQQAVDEFTPKMEEPTATTLMDTDTENRNHSNGNTDSSSIPPPLISDEITENKELKLFGTPELVNNSDVVSEVNMAVGLSRIPESTH